MNSLTRRNATNHNGWQIETLLPKRGWWPMSLPFKDKGIAETVLISMRKHYPHAEFRVYEALKGKKDARYTASP